MGVDGSRSRALSPYMHRRRDNSQSWNIFSLISDAIHSESHIVQVRKRKRGTARKQRACLSNSKSPQWQQTYFHSSSFASFVFD